MRRLRLQALGLAALAAAGPLQAQGPAGWLQADGFYHHVTNDFGDWKGVGIQAHVPTGTTNVWFGDLIAQEAFKDRGVYLSGANRHQFGSDWFTFVGVGGGTGDYYFPDLRVDAQVGRAWLGRKNLVTTVGAMYANSKSVYQDVALTGSLAVYLPGVTIEGGGRVNWSSPGQVTTGRGYGAVTAGRERKRFVTLRVAGGYEGYQLTGAVETEQKFQSYEASLSWREWLGGHVGTFVQLVWYHNPFYTRNGITAGVFRHW